jgi:Spy/CpxP family protein refolding chaperone
MMKNVRSYVFAAALGLGSLSAVGCGGSVEQPQTQTQASAASKAPVAPQTHGVVKLFGEALGEVSLRPEQRTELEKLAIAADQRHAAMADGKKDLMLTLADQIEKGSVDKGALQPKIDRIVADAEKGRPDDQAALARVHAILDPDQRNAFADALEAKFKGKHHGHGGPSGEKGEKGENGDHPKMGGMHGMMQLAADLKLTDEQKTQIKDAIKSGHEGRDGHSFREMHQRMGEGKKVMDSFRTEKFDPSAATPATEQLRTRVTAGTGRMVGIVEKVVPILTPEQRKIAADKLRGMANAGAEMPFGH